MNVAQNILSSCYILHIQSYPQVWKVSGKQCLMLLITHFQVWKLNPKCRNLVHNPFSRASKYKDFQGSITKLSVLCRLTFWAIIPCVLVSIVSKLYFLQCLKKPCPLKMEKSGKSNQTAEEYKVWVLWKMLKWFNMQLTKS